MLKHLGRQTVYRSVLSRVSKQVVRSKSVAVDDLADSVGANFQGSGVFAPTDAFQLRHMGSAGEDRSAMLKAVGFESMEELIDSTIPSQIRLERHLSMEPAYSESEALARIKSIMSKNVVSTDFIGMGYFETLTPNVILRNVLENPGWYTAYTPYQAEISQGRLESLLNFQTMVADLTGLSLSNASLLDESTAAAEGMAMCYSLKNQKKKKFFIDENVHPQSIAVCATRAYGLGIELVVGNVEEADFSGNDFCGVTIQYPNTYGGIQDWSEFVNEAHAHGVMVVAATDLMASSILKPVGEMGVDIAVGSAQRFGVPMGFGGPHAGFLATNEKSSRKMPGRIIGVSIDATGKPALRMAMQTREQHIRRDKATSNICTAQALLANMAGFYGVYHGPEGIKDIATKIHGKAVLVADTLRRAGYTVPDEHFFDTFRVKVTDSAEIQRRAEENGLNLRVIDDETVGISLGEGIRRKAVERLVHTFGLIPSELPFEPATTSIPAELKRTSDFMTHPVFNSHHSETKMMRYLKKLENKDLSLNTSMISLGSCTMKLNAASEMIPITWTETSSMHPFAPSHQTQGYTEMIADLNKDLATITGFAAVSPQPNSGAQGEYAGLMAIKAYHESRGDFNRNICLIPVSAHGTNPASAAMSGMKVVVVKSDEAGNIDVDDLFAKAEHYKDNLGALMITYPSTYGVFEECVKIICDKIHACGGQVYMDGANMNAQVAYTSPGYIGADVCHLNLHKTFCIPHGGGGPGVGSIGVAEHLAPFLPGHPVVPTGGDGLSVVPKTNRTVAGAPFGSAAILPISWMYIKMLGEAGLKESTNMAILNANYMAKRLEEGYDVLFKGTNGQCAHEFIVDLRSFKEFGIVEEDIAKRLQDYGFHSPTMSWPVGGTIMIEPTESEDKEEMDRFCDALLMIRKEVQDIMDGKIILEESPLKLAPHTMDVTYDDDWNRAYSRKTAAFPAPWVTADNKFWPTVSRVDNVYGDRNLQCSCPPIEVYETADRSA